MADKASEEEGSAGSKAPSEGAAGSKAPSEGSAGSKAPSGGAAGIKAPPEGAAGGSMRSIATGAVLLGLGFAAGFVVGKSSSAAGAAVASVGPGPGMHAPSGSARPGAGPAGSASGGGPTGTPGVKAPADVIALLDGLKQGDEVATWKVGFIMLPSSGDMVKSVTVGLEKGEERFLVSFAAIGVLKYQANYQTEQYAFYYSTETPGAPLAADREAAVKAVQERVARMEKTVARPAAL